MLDKQMRLFYDAQNYSKEHLTNSDRKQIEALASEGHISKLTLQTNAAVRKQLVALKRAIGAGHSPLKGALLLGVLQPKLKLRCPQCDELRIRFHPEVCAKCCLENQDKARRNRSAESRAKTAASIKRTVQRKYGKHVTNAMQVDSVRRKQLKNVRKAYGERKDDILEKRKSTMLAEYGVDHQIHIPETRRRIFGVKNVRINGKTYEYQGYEDHAIRKLLADGFKVSTDCTGIAYINSEGKRKKYYPDIKAWRGKRRLLVEVKSAYTFNWTKSTCPEKLFAGTRSALKQGADFVVWVIDTRTKTFREIKNPSKLKHLRLSATQQIRLD